MDKVLELQSTKDKDGEVKLIKGEVDEDDNKLVILLEFTCANDANDGAEGVEDMLVGEIGVVSEVLRETYLVCEAGGMFTMLA